MYHHTDWIMVLSLRRDVVVCLFYIFKLLQETLFFHYDIAFNDIKVWTGNDNIIQAFHSIFMYYLNSNESKWSKFGVHCTKLFWYSVVY